MKHKITNTSCGCHYFTLLLVTTNIIAVSPKFAIDMTERSDIAARSPQWNQNHRLTVPQHEAGKATMLLTTASVERHFKASHASDNYKSDVQSIFMPVERNKNKLWGRTRYARQAEEEPIDKCRLFEEGDPEKNEFYSPDYPNDYPKNINCTRVITAPKGQIIRLDFRNSFHIEAKDECKFDFLEIRDGPYGYSSLIGKYCGTDFPPEITSKERYLWLHFHSDESIEYSGFTAVYEFIDRNREIPSADLNCTIEKDGFEGFVNSSDIPAEIREAVMVHKIPLDCVWRIQVQENWKIQVKFLDFKLSKPNDCETNFLDIFPEQTVMPLRVKNFCGSAGEGITSESNILHMHFYAEQVAISSTFAILYTAFRDKGSGCLEETEYDCEDATCIAKDLRCNGRNNCKFSWDEEKCSVEEGEQSEHVTIIIIVFGLILGGMVITFLINCIRKIMHDQKIIREHIRQSRESKLDEIGRRSKARSTEHLASAMLRPKPSQGSLELIEDTGHYYRELVPVSLEVNKNDMKEKEHSILRHRTDMVVQTSFCSAGDDSSSEATMEAGAKPGNMMVNACDMGCQTRESLFATPFIQKQSSIASAKDKAPKRSLSRFSTFGYDSTPAQSAPMTPADHAPALQTRHARDTPEHIEMKTRPPPRQAPPPQRSGGPYAMPQEVCHHHHQHAPHKAEHAAAHQHIYTQQMSQTPSEPAGEPTPPGKKSQGQTGKPAATASGKKTPKISQTTAYIDVRSSAPDVIIMTSQ